MYYFTIVDLQVLIRFFRITCSIGRIVYYYFAVIIDELHTYYFSFVKLHLVCAVVKLHSLFCNNCQITCIFFWNFRTTSIILLMVELYVLFLFCQITCIFYYMYCLIVCNVYGRILVYFLPFSNVVIVDLYIIIYYCQIICINFLINIFISSKICHLAKSGKKYILL